MLSIEMREEGIWGLCSIFALGIDFVYWKVNTNMNSDTCEETCDSLKPNIWSSEKEKDSFPGHIVQQIRKRS